MKDGAIRYISSFRDFVELIDEYMGFDCKRYAEELQDEIEELQDEIEELQDKLEGKVEK